MFGVRLLIKRLVRYISKREYFLIGVTETSEARY